MATASQPIQPATLETGDGFGGMRVAILRAPVHTPPSSLLGMRESLASQGISVQPDYTSKDGHMLRLGGFSSDTEVSAALRQEENFAPPIRPLPDEACPNERNFSRMLRDYSGSLAGLSYLAGDAGLLISAAHRTLPAPQALGHNNTNWFRAAAGLSYLAANLTLIGFGNTRQEDARETVRQAVATLYDTPQERKDAFSTADSVYRNIRHFLTRYPWETASALSLAGCGLQAASGISDMGKRGKSALWETALSLGNMVGLLIPLVVPEKGGRALLGAGRVTDREDGTGLVDSLRHWVEEKPLRAAARISQASNLGHLAFGLHRRDYGYAGAYGSYFLGNTLQGMTSKGRGPGLEELLDHAAGYLAAHAGQEIQAAQVERMAQALADRPEVDFTAQTLRKGLTARLQAPSRQEPEHSAFEMKAMAHSPFLSQAERHLILSHAITPPLATR